MVCDMSTCKITMLCDFIMLRLYFVCDDLVFVAYEMQDLNDIYCYKYHVVCCCGNLADVVCDMVIRRPKWQRS